MSYLIPLPRWMRLGALLMDQSEPYDTPPIVPAIPRDHLEPAGVRVTKRLEQNDCLLEAAALYKALWIRERMRAGRPGREDIYTAIEMDHARDEMKAWSAHPDGKGRHLYT